MTKIGADLELANHMHEVHRNERLLDRYVADEMEGALFLALMLIEEHAKKAQERLNRLRWNPMREPMGG